MIPAKVRMLREALVLVRKKNQQAQRLIRLCHKDLRVNLLGQILPIRPYTLNLLVNDICNSRCQMRSVWKQKRDKEFTPDELSLILSDPLFSNLRYVGVSGGEPTLRGDLPEIYRVLIQKHPLLHGTGIITNAIRKDDVIARILASAKICRGAGVPFNVMVSLDGIGEVHDRIRGCEGNFENAVKVIHYFRDETDILISIGCTITKDNVWHVDEVLDFCRSEGVYGRFRVAEFIRRLHNEDQSEFIRNFSEHEAYHIGLFFAKLEYSYEKSAKIKRTYRSIRRMLLEGAERSTKCHWQSTAVTLDCRGHLLYCAPRSPVLGSCLEESARGLYWRNIGKRKAIIENDCCNCIHDYHADETISELRADIKDRSWRRLLSLDKALAEAKNNEFSQSGFHRNYEPHKFLIIGWYGTETAGDKAILGEIIYQIREKHPGSRVVLASLNPYLSQWTVRELGYTDVEVIPTYSATFWQHTSIVDEIIMGGGPLMHLEQLGVVLWAFMRAKKAGHNTRIAGCGIGPLGHGQKYQDAVKLILRLADTIELRDSASVAWAKCMIGRDDIINSGDPAVRFANRWMSQHLTSERAPFLNLYLRDWTTEYQGCLTDREFEETKAQFQEQLGEWIHEVCVQLDIRPRLLAMHHFCIGNDDRDFNRRFARTYLSTLNPVVELAPFSVQEILASMQEGTLSLCMRFHSVIFANTLDVPFFAIDYTQGSKIFGYLADHGRLDRMVSVGDVAKGRWRSILRKSKVADSLNAQ
jgi:MoaA/NifB/PqqE/SkfB family radical SAM enzyme/polysaccharide pyruvyl transferase WcaK-like protein